MSPDDSRGAVQLTVGGTSNSRAFHSISLSFQGTCDGLLLTAEGISKDTRKIRAVGTSAPLVSPFGEKTL
jgi:hypothetical protein